MNALTVLRNLFAFIFILLITACGGDGGGLKVNKNNVTDVFELNGLRTDNGITVSWTSLQVSKIAVTTPTGTAPPSWLNVSFTGNRTPISLSIGITNSNLAVGSYQTAVRVNAINLLNEAMDFEDININFEVKERPSASPQSISISMVEGTLPPSQTITLSRNNDTVDILPTSFISGFTRWVNFSINGQSVELNFSSNTQALAIGPHRTNLYINSLLSR